MCAFITNTIIIKKNCIATYTDINLIEEKPKISYSNYAILYSNYAILYSNYANFFMLISLVILLLIGYPNDYRQSSKV